MNQANFNLEPDPYPSGFEFWLRKNAHIYRAFEYRALEMAMSGRKRYSARCIIESIRYDTDLSDSGVLFKCDGNHVPGLARLFLEKYGERFPKFFELRG